MATTTPANMQVYNDEVQGAYVETFAQNVSAFNAASGGAIQLVNDSVLGYYDRESFFDVGADVEVRDPTSDSAVDDVNFTTDEFIGVKIFRSYRRKVNFASMKLTGQALSKGAQVYGAQLANKSIRDKLNTAIASLAAALSQHSGVVSDTSGSSGGLTHVNLNTGFGKLGDAMDRIRTVVMHSTQWTNLVGNTLAATTQVYSGLGVQIFEGTGPGVFGKRVIVTDAPALVIAGSPADYVTLGLTEMAAVVKEDAMPVTVSDIVTGEANLATRYQSEWEYTLSLKGHKWDIGNGGSAPDASDLTTATNWDLVVADLKDGPGVYMRTQ